MRLMYSSSFCECTGASSECEKYPLEPDHGMVPDVHVRCCASSISGSCLAPNLLIPPRSRLMANEMSSKASYLGSYRMLFFSLAPPMYKIPHSNPPSRRISLLGVLYCTRHTRTPEVRTWHHPHVYLGGPKGLSFGHRGGAVDYRHATFPAFNSDYGVNLASTLLALRLFLP